jgi:hypothetical protein
VNADVTTRRHRLPWPSMVTATVGLILVLFGLSVVLGLPAHQGVGLAVVALVAAGLGLVIARRQPGNRIAWLLLVFGVVIAFYQDVASYSVLDYHFHHGRLPLGPAAVVITSELWSTPFLVLPLIILLFPDGRLPSRGGSRCGRTWASAL